MIAKPEREESGINWQDVRQRLAAAQQAVQSGGELTAEEEQRVLDERAEQLSQVPEQAPDTSEILEVITFHMAGERFAMETRFVRKVTKLSRITPVPSAPDFLLGVINLRGEVTALIDLSVFFNNDQQEEPESPQILVLGVERVEFGIKVDRIDQVMSLRIDQILEPPGSVLGASREYLHGVTQDAMLVLDGEVLINDQRLYMDEVE